MRKVFIALGIVLIVFIGGGYLVLSNLDAIVENAIETAGTQAVGSQVAVGGVELDLTGGRATIRDFTIANPQGYSSNSMVSFSELSVGMNLQNTDGQTIHITSIVANDPFVHYETISGTSNFDTVAERFESEEQAPPPEDEVASDIQLIIDQISINNIQATLDADMLPDPVDVGLGDINLSSLSGTSNEIAGQVSRQLMNQIANAATAAVLQSSAELITNTAEAVAEELEGQLDEKRNEVLDSVDEEVGEVLNNVGNLFGGGEDD